MASRAAWTSADPALPSTGDQVLARQVAAGKFARFWLDNAPPIDRIVGTISMWLGQRTTRLPALTSGWLTINGTWMPSS